MRHRSALAVAVALSATGLLAVPGSEAPDRWTAALEAEISRSMALQIEDLEKPYYVAYRLRDASGFEIEATLGQIVAEPEVQKGRLLRAEVRVGSYDLDSSEFVGRGGPFGSRMDVGRGVTIDDDDAAFRYDAWLATDDAYKAAVERIAQKRAALKNRIDPEAVADFTKEPPVVESAPAPPLPSWNLPKWRETVRRLSAVFRDFPAVQDSGARVRAGVGQKYLVTSEGTRLRQPTGAAIVAIRASAQAADGMPVRSFAGFLARKLEDLPSDAELLAAARRVAETTTALASAPTLESYSGPVLLSGQASAEFFAQLLAPNLSGHRPPMTAAEPSGPRDPFADRLNRPVLPDFLSVSDDPTQTAFAGRPLLGAYTFDDEGVRVAPVSLVENGSLRTFLMSRRPRKEFGRSNGHGRAAAFGSVNATIGNLFIRVADGKGVADPKAELLRMCKEQGLKSGIAVRVLDQFSLSAGQFGSGPGRRGPLSSPVEVYRVYVEDGREELLRGVLWGEISPRTLKDIAAASQELYVHNRGGEDGGSVPTSVIAPAILFQELELTREPASRQKPPLLESPLASRPTGR